MTPFGNPGWSSARRHADSLDDCAGIGAAQRQDKPLHRFALAVLCHCAVTGQAADVNRSDVAQPQHTAAEILDDDLLEIGGLGDGAFRAHHQGLFALAEPSRTVVAISWPRLRYIRSETPRPAAARAALSGTTSKVRTMPSERIDVSHAGNRAQSRSDASNREAAALFE